MHGLTWTEHRLYRQRPAKPANNHADADADADSDADAYESNLLHSFSIPAPTSELRQNMGEPGEGGHLKIIIMSMSMMSMSMMSMMIMMSMFRMMSMMSMSMLFAKICANATSSLDPEH